MKPLNVIAQFVNAIGVIFRPITTPLARVLTQLGLRSRRSTWQSPAMQKTKAQFMRQMFQPLAETKQSMGPQMILRPVNVWFIFLSLFLAFLLNLLPWGSYAWVPDFLALTLMFWSVREPRIISLGIAFSLGLLMDVHDATVLGEHALAYTLLSYAAAILSRRLPAFSLPMQALQVWPIFTFAMLITYAIRVFFGGMFPGWVATVVAPTFCTILWPLASWILLAPQRRPIEIDETRPL